MKLTHEEILALIDQGIYRVDLEAGIVTSGKTGKPLSIKLGGRTGDYPKHRLFHKGRMREIAVAHIIWIAGSRRPIPPGFEIHHRNTNNQDSRWDNLFCLFELDHRKLHYGDDLIETQDTPF